MEKAIENTRLELLPEKEFLKRVLIYQVWPPFFMDINFFFLIFHSLERMIVTRKKKSLMYSPTHKSGILPHFRWLGKLANSEPCNSSCRWNVVRGSVPTIQCHLWLPFAGKTAL